VKSAAWWADAYQRTAVYGRFAEWEAILSAENMAEDAAYAQVGRGRWEQSDIGARWAQCTPSTDGYHWYPVESITEISGFRGAAHGGFSFGSQLREMRPERTGAGWELVGRPVAAPVAEPEQESTPEPAQVRLTATERNAVAEVAVQRVNAALDTLAEECQVNLYGFKLFAKSGRVSAMDNRKELPSRLAFRAVPLHTQFADQTALEDEVASICGLLAE
jgi:hypothetical protein